MAQAGSFPILPGIARFTAPLLFGPLFNWGLYGVLCVQTYVYSYNFPDDRRLIKILGKRQRLIFRETHENFSTAYLVFLLETAQTALTGADVYYWFIAGFGELDASGLQNTRFSPIDIVIMDGLISLIIQLFFCYRIWILNKRLLWFCVVIAVLSITQATGSFLGGQTIFRFGISRTPQGEYFSVVKLSLYLWFVASVSADILIAAAMFYLLRQTRGNQNRYTNYVFPRVVRLTVETNTLTATVTIVTFVLYVVFPNEVYYVTPAGIIGKL
ncbi:hypothetical protein BJV78DRAFT_1280833 [Lactifluus subvellereus]|nr:hypothetical protein BJV78DRAFT_1280833 [Lactifluus subvellereus]